MEKNSSIPHLLLEQRNTQFYDHGVIFKETP